MSDSQPFGFGKFVPGFDFLQNLGKEAGRGLPHMPSLSAWVAPTLDVKELDKRIQELKAVQFWLDQNIKALAATVQALEVQKMTLSTLDRMNLRMGDLAAAFKPGGAPAEAPASTAPAAEASEPASPTRRSSKKSPATSPAVDPLQWWGALTQQFQQIAAAALADMPAAGAPRSASAAASRAPGKTASKAAGKKAAPRASQPRAARKTAKRR